MCTDLGCSCRPEIFSDSFFWAQIFFFRFTILLVQTVCLIKKISDAKFFGPKMNFNERQLLDRETGLLNRNFFEPTMVFINNFVGRKKESF